MKPERILLAGASSDLAGALVERLARWSPRPALLAHHHRGAARVAALRERYGPSLEPVMTDLAGPGGAEALAAEVRSRWEHPDALVYCPALPLRLARLKDWDEDRLCQDLELQVLSLARLLRAFLPAMSRAATRTRVVVISSAVVRGVPPRFMAAYTTAKYAQLGLLRALAADYAGTSVTLNAVAPAMVATRFLDELPEKAVELAAAQAPGGRHLSPDDVAGVLEFLLSPGSDPLHGVDLPVALGQVP